MRGHRRKMVSLLIGAAIVASSSCSGGGGGDPASGRSQEGEEADPSDDYCATVAEVMSGGRAAPSTDVSSQDAVGGLFAAFSAYAELRNAIEDLADAAPEDLSDEYDTVSDAFSTMPDVSDPLTALAGALFTGVNLTIAFDRIDEVTSEQCGVMLFTFDPAMVETITTPYVNDEGYTVLDARNLFGSSPCDSQGSIVAAQSETRLVLDCNEGQYIGVDLAAYEVTWSIEVPAALGADYDTIRDRRAFNANAGLMAFVDLDVTPADGFSGERREVAVTGRSLDDGQETYHVVLPRPAGTVDELEVGTSREPTLEVMGADGTAIVRTVWPMVDRPWVGMLYGVAPDGTIAWQKETGYYVFVISNAQSREFVELTAPNSPPDVISIRTGASAIPAGVPSLTDATSAFSDGCSSIFAIHTDSALTVLDAATGQAHTEPIPESFGSTTNTPTGVYYEPGAGVDSIFVAPDGVKWRMAEGLATGPQTAYGRLFMTNQSGMLLEVDQATGEPLSTSAATVPPQGFAVDGGVVVSQLGLDGLWTRLEPTEIVCG